MAKKEQKKDFIITIDVLTGSDSKCFNAIVNSIRAGNFINFNQHFSSEMGDFFTKSYIEENGKKVDLSVAYEHLPMDKLKKIWNEVYELRSNEFNKIFDDKEFNFEELNKIDKIRYTLLYVFGDKLGGYPAIASLNLGELLKLNKFFFDFKALENGERGDV